MAPKNYYLGIDVGGTKIKTVVLNESNNIIEQFETLTHDGSKEARWKKKILAIITQKTTQYRIGKNSPINCGISAPGLVDCNNQMTLHMPKRLQGIENFNWSEATGLDIKVINDGHSACLAEYEMYHRKKGIRHLLMITLGTGVGGGIILNGQLYQGHLQRAGHIGHITLDSEGPPTMTNMPGSFEYALGNFSVFERTLGKFSSVKTLVEAHQKGDSQATQWWLESVRKLAVALASLINVLSPEQLVVGGGITNGAGAILLEPLKKYMNTYEWRPNGKPTPITTAKLGTYSGAIGAALFTKIS